jgi:hypothetical protein
LLKEITRILQKVREEETKHTKEKDQLWTGPWNITVLVGVNVADADDYELTTSIYT